MSQFILVTESGADLPQKYIDRFNIKIVPMYVNFGENTFKDSDIKAEDVLIIMRKTKFYLLPPDQPLTTLQKSLEILTKPISMQKSYISPIPQ